MKQKWFAFLLLAITAAGTFIPCCEQDNCCADHTATATNHEQGNAEGTCSPFFSCATCPVAVELSKQIQLTPPIIRKQIYPGTSVAFTLISFAYSYWQPPRAC